MANRDWERTFPPMSFELNKTGLLMLTAWLALGQAQRSAIEVDVFDAGKIKAIPVSLEGLSLIHI